MGVRKESAIINQEGLRESRSLLVVVPNPSPPKTPATRSTWLAVFFWVFLGHAYFYNGASWNQNARYNIIYSFVEPGTADTLSFRIDRFMTDPGAGMNTGDWAFFDGHYYSNKPIGTAILGIPLYATLFFAQSVLGFDPTSVPLAQTNAYLLNLWISVFWTALATVVLMQFWHRCGRPLIEAFWIGLFFAYGTLMFPFDTQLWSHPTASSLVLIALCVLLRGPGIWKPTFVAGCAMGLAVHLDYLAAIGAVIGGVILVSQQRFREVAIYCLGGLPFALFLGFYHWLCFGSPFQFASGLSNPIFTESQMVLGQFSGPSLEAFWGLLFSLNRGILIFMPALVLVGIPMISDGTSLHRRSVSLQIALGAILSILVICCFRDWHGGSTTGSRYLIVSLPFWVLLMPMMLKLPQRGRRLAKGLIGLSCALMFLVAAINPMLSPDITNPWWVLIQDLVNQAFPKSTWLTHMTRHPTNDELTISTFNGGMWLGRGLISLIPYLGLWLFSTHALANHFTSLSPKEKLDSVLESSLSESLN